MTTRKRKGKGKQAAAEAAPAAADIGAATLANLHEIRAKLDGVDKTSLSSAEFEKWFDEFSAVRAAILDLRTARFKALNEEQAAKAQEMADAIDGAEDALHGVQDGAKIISAVGKVLGIIGPLVSLLA